MPVTTRYALIHIPEKNHVEGTFADVSSAGAFLADVIGERDFEGIVAGHYRIDPSPETALGPTVIISLDIENAYELHGEYKVTVTNAVIPAPPADRTGDAFEQWAYDNIYCWTGMGFEDGDSWYDVKVTDCTDSTLVGHAFDWGY